MPYSCHYQNLYDLKLDSTKLEDWICHLIIEMDEHLIKDDKYMLYSAARGEAYRGYLADFYRHWEGLKNLHKNNCESESECDKCPSENKEIIDGLEDIVKRLDNNRMEEMLECIIEFIQNNKSVVNPCFFQQQIKHATNMFSFWKGMERLAYAPRLVDLQARETGSPIFNNERRIFNTLFPKK